MNGPMLQAAVVSSAAVLAGAAAACIPVVIHLLSRRRFRRVRWAAMDWLLEADRQNRRRVRLEQLVLLALRCGAMFLIGLMLARWYVQPRSLAAVVGAADRTERIVVLDDSYSMGVRTDAGTVFDAGRSVVVRLARWLQQESPQDSLTVLLASRPDRSVTARAVLRETSLDTLAERVHRCEPSPRGPCLANALRAVRRWLDERSDVAAAMVYVVSDFQAFEWAAADGPSPADALRGWADDRRRLALVLIDVGADDRENLCVSALDPDPGRIAAGVASRFVARVVNHGRRDAPATTLRPFIGAAPQADVPVPPIPAGRSVAVPFELTIGEVGAAAVGVELPGDRLPADNRRDRAIDVQRSVQVLVVNGEPDADAFVDEVALLSAALRPEGPVYSGNDVEVVEEGRLDDISLDRYDVVMAANVYRFTEATIGQLERFAESGGGVVFFLGDQVDPELYNRLLWRGGAGLLPCRLGERVRVAAAGAGYEFTSPDYTHPMFRHFAGSDVPFFRGIRTREFFACEPSAPATGPVPPATTRPSSAPGARVLLSYTDGHPAMVEKAWGRGHVVLIPTTADKEWTNLPDHFTFVVLVQDLVQHVARPSEPDAGGTVGEPIVLDVEPGRFDPQVAVRTPDAPDGPEASAQVRHDGPGGSPRLTWGDTGAAGVYRFSFGRGGARERVRLAAVNVDPREGNLARATPEQLREAAAGVPVRYVRGDEMIADVAANARTELWAGVLAALVVVLMSETVLAWWFSVRSE